MKTKLHLIICLLITTIGYSQISEDQKYKQLSQKENANYYTIVADARAEFATKDLTILANKKANKQFERWAYYWENSINADGTFPNENSAYFNAGILDANGKIAVNNYVAFSANNNESWTNVGPEQTDLDNNGYSNYPQMGRLNVLLRIKHPSNMNQDVLFVGAPGGGIWKSTDGGANWTPKLDMVAGIGVTDIKTVPGTTFANYTTQPIYVSTGDYDGGNVKSIGVLKSTDGGETFNSTGFSFNLTQQKSTGDLIVIDANTVFVGSSQYIKKTTDGGTTWTNAFNSGYGNGNFGRAAINGTEIMYSGLWELYYTSDYTVDSNWKVVIGLSGSNSKRAVTVDENGDFYIQNINGQVQLFNKTAETFSNVGNIPSGYNAQGGFNQALVVTNDLMITGEFNGQSSTDAGANWTRTLNGYWSNSSSPGTYIHSDHHRMGRLDNPLEFWSANDGGLSYITYSSVADLKPAVDYKSGKVIVTQSYSISINPNADDGAFMMANQDNDAFSKRNGTWYAVAMGDGIQSAINYNTPDIRYAASQNGNIARTTTGFQGQLQGIGPDVTVPGANFYFPLEIHKTNPTILYAGGNPEVHIIDASSTAPAPMAISNANTGLTGSSIKSIATHGNSVMAANSNAMRFSADQGSTWSSVTIPSGVSTVITSVEYDATNNDVRYVTYGGYTTGNKIYKTTDGGANWTNISSNLPNIVVNEVLLKQNQTGEYLFLATELGVYFTTNGGTNWERLGQGLPNVRVTDIEIHYTTDKLAAGTYGRGLWELNIANTTLSTSTVENTLEVSIYPNPAKDILNVELKDNGNYNYVIYNVVGGLVKKGALNNASIDVSGLARNLYLIRIFNDNNSVTKKIIIE